MIKKTGASSLTEYANAAMLYSMLTPEREIELVKRYQTEGCLKARDEIAHAHLRYVMTIARNLGGGRVDREDLIQEGCIGLLVAMDKFQVEQGFRFAMYATHWIKAGMKEYMLNNARMFRIATTKAQRKCYYNLHKFKKEGRVFNQREVENIAAELNVPIEDVREMEKKLVSSDLSIDLDPIEGADLLNSLYDEDIDPALIAERDEWNVKMPMKLQEVINGLDDRTKLIVNDRWFIKDTKTLQELSAIHNVSHERVRQIEKKAMASVQQTMQQFAA